MRESVKFVNFHTFHTKARRAAASRTWYADAPPKRPSGDASCVRASPSCTTDARAHARTRTNMHKLLSTNLCRLAVIEARMREHPERYSADRISDVLALYKLRILGDTLRMKSQVNISASLIYSD
jgi:hypothetical protein